MSNRTDRFLASAQEARAQFFEDKSPLPYLAALIYAVRDDDVNGEALSREAEELLRDPALEGQAGNGVPVAAAILRAHQVDRDRADAAYRALRSRFIPSPHLVLAACAMSSMAVPREDFDDLTRKTDEVLREMREDHPFLTGYDDLAVALLLANQGAAPAVVGNMERILCVLREEYPARNGTQALSAILASGDASGEAALRAIRIGREMKARKVDLGRGWQAAALGAMALAEGSESELAASAAEAAAQIRSSGVMGPLFTGRRDRAAYAAILAASESGAPEEAVFAAILALASASITDDLSGLDVARRSDGAGVDPD